MIVSHQHRYIFFAVPKTATHSVRDALRHYLSDDDWEQQMLFGEQVIPIPEIAEIAHGHVSVQQLKSVLDGGQWNDYFRFGFVRNPFDRFVSTCAFLNRQNPRFHDNSLAWMKEALERPAFQQRILVMPQSTFLANASGEVDVDFVGRYEELQESIDKIFEHLGLPSTHLKILNRSERADYRAYYDKDLRRLVGEFYHADLELFNYNF